MGKRQNIQPTKSMKINNSLNGTSSQKRQTRQQRGEQQMKLVLMVSGYNRMDCIKVSKVISQTKHLMIDDSIDQQSRNSGRIGMLKKQTPYSCLYPDHQNE